MTEKTADESGAVPLDDDAGSPDSSDEATPEPKSARTGFFGSQVVREYWPIVVLLIVIALICRAFYESGHDWGDDFALYIHQAQALVNGNTGEVIANNRYAIDNSGWSTFSPLIYPWGFPMMLAPVVAIWGVNYAKLKLVVVLSFLGYLFCLYRLVQRRAGTVPAVLLVAIIGSSVSFVGWTSTVGSDYPYLFFVGVTLLWLDRCRLRARFEADGLRDLVILGLLIAFAFSIRREGLALLAALVAVHVVTIAPRFLHRGPAFVPGNDGYPVATPKPSARWSRVATPYVTFIGAVIGLQLILPSVVFPHFPGTGTQQIKPNIIWFRDILAEQIGMKDPGVPRLALLGTWRWAALAIALFIVLAVLGLLVRLLVATAEDIVIATYLLGVAYIVLTAPFHEGRYLLGITPLLAYFAYQAMPSLAKWSEWLVRPAVVVSCLLLAGIVVANATDMKPAIKYHLADTAVINGPTTPAALEMEAKVKECTRGDDVVVFFRARAMTMLTDRKSIQTGNINQVLSRADWYVMNVGSDYSQPLVTTGEAKRLGLRKVWQNSEWVLWLIPGGAAANRRLPC